MSFAFPTRPSHLASDQPVPNPRREEEVNNDADTAEKSRGFKALKAHPLFAVPTDDYVDDTDEYEPRITREQRLEYWQQLPTIAERKKVIASDGEEFVSWIAAESQAREERHHFRFFYIQLGRIGRSKRWDQLAIDFLLIGILIEAICTDTPSWIEIDTLVTLNEEYSLSVLAFLFSFLCLLIPVLITLFLSHECRDLVKFNAAINFGDWAFCVVLLTQYIEFAYYGGCGKAHLAGNCHTDGEQPLSRIFGRLKVLIMKAFGARTDAKIMADSSVTSAESGTSQSNEDDGSSLSLSSSLDDPNSLSSSPLELQVDDHMDDVEAQIESVADEIEETVKSASPLGNGLTELENSPQITNRDDTTEVSGRETEGEASSVPGVQKEPEKTTEELLQQARYQLTSDDRYSEWDCIVCNRHNRALKVNPDPGITIYRSERGKHIKHTFALFAFNPSEPTCSHCYTVMSYKPPIGSAHLFPHFENKHEAFADYPPLPRIQLGQSLNDSDILHNRIHSLLFGVQQDPYSLALTNDWRLPLYIANLFPEVPRAVLKDDERYEISEIVECKQQKIGWHRCRIVAIKANGMYDIRYDTGEEIRFVRSTALRLPTEKAAFAYYIELGLIALVLTAPLGALIATFEENLGLIFLFPTLISAVWFGLRLYKLVQYCVNFYAAGILVHIRFASVFLIPLFFFFVACFFSALNAANRLQWVTICGLFIFVFVVSLPLVYVTKPLFALVLLPFYVLLGVSLIVYAFYQTYPDVFGSPFYVSLPVVLLLVMLKFVRHYLVYIWDVCLVIRPATGLKTHNPPLWESLKNMSQRVAEYFREEVVGVV